MKKNLLYLFALICSMSLFTACSDDDEDTAWKEIPQIEIPVGTDGVTLSVNGVTSSTGSVQMTVENGSKAVLNLNNVIPGYSKVPVDVDLQKQTDGSFRFAGQAELSDSPAMMTRATDQKTVIYIVAAEGNITSDGKVTATITSELSEEAKGGLVGKWDLISKMPTTDMGTASIAPLWVTWPAKNPDKTNLEGAAYAISALTGGIMYNLLSNVTFNADGNITANYNNSKDLGMETLMGYMGGMEDDGQGNTILMKVHENWADSPKNMAYWYVKDGLLYVVPNIAAIMKQVGSGSENAGNVDLVALLGMLGEYNINIEALLPYIQTWMTTGIPLKYTASADGLKVYVDKDMAAPFITALLPALDVLQLQIDAILSDPAQAETGFLIQMVFGLLGISSLTDIATVWNENTAGFEIALNFVK